MAQKIDTRAVGLDVGLAAVKFLTGRENLHYGLWDGLEVIAANVGPAQEAYTAKLFSHLPDGPLRILDIGGGAGETARKLIALGHSVDIIVPSAYLAERCRAACPTATVHEMMFEDFKGEGPFDLCLFSESFQYMPMDFSLPRAAGLLAEGGAVLIADCFRSAAYDDPNRTSRVGGGHPYAHFAPAVAAAGLKAVFEEDITESVAPSVQIEQDFYHVIGLGVDRLGGELAAKKPGLHRIIRGVLNTLLGKRRTAKLYDRLTGESRSPEHFITLNRYIMTKLVRAD